MRFHPNTNGIRTFTVISYPMYARHVPRQLIKLHISQHLFTATQRLCNLQAFVIAKHTTRICHNRTGPGNSYTTVKYNGLSTFCIYSPLDLVQMEYYTSAENNTHFFFTFCYERFGMTFYHVRWYKWCMSFHGLATNGDICPFSADCVTITRRNCTHLFLLCAVCNW